MNNSVDSDELLTKKCCISDQFKSYIKTVQLLPVPLQFLVIEMFPLREQCGIQISVHLAGLVMYVKIALVVRALPELKKCF